MAFAVIQNGTRTDRDRNEDNRKAKRLIARRVDTPAMKARRRKYQADPAAWLLYYCGKNMFPFPFSDGHRAIIKNTLEAALTGTGSATAAPRGEGKTTVARGVAVYMLACKIVRFPVLVGWKHEDAKAAMKTWLRMFVDSPTFTRDYWHICEPFLRSTHSTALKNIAWKDTGKPTGAGVDNALKVITLPDSLGAIACRSAQGDAKGLNAIMPDGTVIRPDFILFDDAQDPDKARSPEMVRKTIDRLENVFMGMAGPQKRLTAAVCCTVEAKDDVSEHFLNRPGFRSIRVPRIKTWPGGGGGGDWPDAKKPQVAAWEEWNQVRLTQGENAGIKHYRDNKARLTEGMEVSWPERYDRERGDPDAFYAAMWDRYDKGADVFSRGQQNQPIDISASAFNLTAQDIITHTIDTPRLIIPPAATIIGGHCDINRAGLHWALAAFDQQMSPHVFDYGRHPRRGELFEENANEHTRHAAIFTGLKHLFDDIAGRQYTREGLRIQPGLILIDASYESNVVHRFCEQARYPFKVVPAIGRNASKYRFAASTLVGKPAEQCHFQRPMNRRAPYAMFSACYWREVRQRAFLSEPGAPGGCTLFHATDPRYHLPFAEHQVAEKMRGKYKTDMGWRWDWTNAPGAIWDWGDAMSGCWVAAALQGLGTSGETNQPKQRPVARVVIRRPGR